MEFEEAEKERDLSLDLSQLEIRKKRSKKDSYEHVSLAAAGGVDYETIAGTNIVPKPTITLLRNFDPCFGTHEEDNEDNDSDFEELDLSDVITNVDDVDAKRDNEFVKMAESTDLEEILDKFKQIKQNIGLSDLPETFTKVFPKLQDDLSAKIPHRYSELLRHLHQRSLNKEYCGNRVAAGKKVSGGAETLPR